MKNNWRIACDVMVYCMVAMLVDRNDKIFLPFLYENYARKCSFVLSTNMAAMQSKYIQS